MCVLPLIHDRVNVFCCTSDVCILVVIFSIWISIIEMCVCVFLCVCVQLPRLQEWWRLHSDVSVLVGLGCALCLCHPVWGLHSNFGLDSVVHLNWTTQLNSFWVCPMCVSAACCGGVQVYSSLVRPQQSNSGEEWSTTRQTGSTKGGAKVRQQYSRTKVMEQEMKLKLWTFLSKYAEGILSEQLLGCKNWSAAAELFVEDGKITLEQLPERRCQAITPDA